MKEFIWNNRVGNIIDFKSYISTSKGEIYDEDMPIRIYIKNSKKGRDIDEFGLKESEVLYERNCQFKILNIYLNEEQKICIHLEEVDG